MAARKPNRETQAHTPKRPARVAPGSGNELSVPAHLIKEGYHYYWAVDKPGELEMFEAAHYEFVLDSRNDKVTTPAGKGLTHYLIRLEQHHYDADMKKQQDKITKTTNVSAQEVGEHEYVPKGRQNVVEREIL